MAKYILIAFGYRKDNNHIDYIIYNESGKIAIIDYQNLKSKIYSFKLQLKNILYMDADVFRIDVKEIDHSCLKTKTS